MRSIALRIRWFATLALALAAGDLKADPVVGHVWQPFHLTDATGLPRDWKPGRITVLSFCAYWCDTWKQQIPRLVEAKRASTGLPVDFVTISVDGRWSEVAQNNRGLPLWLDKGGEWSRAQGIDRVPTTVVIDSTGVVRFVAGSVTRSEDILQAIHQAMRASMDGGPIYLTFDDFPPPQGGDALLDVLRALGVKATLFCMGCRVEVEADLLKRAHLEGHSLQVHSWDHDAANPQIARCREALHKVTSSDPSLYRPPGSETIVGESEHHRIVDPYDFSRPTQKELLRRILATVCSNAVIQLHAGVTVTLNTLPELIAELQRRGFHFELLPSRR